MYSFTQNHPVGNPGISKSNGDNHYTGREEWAKNLIYKKLKFKYKQFVQSYNRNKGLRES